MIMAVLTFGCQNSSSTVPSKDDAIVLTIDGKTRTISAQDLEDDSVNFSESPVRYLFRKKLPKDEKPKFDISFAFGDKESLSGLPKTYNLTENPDLHAIASLSFFDYERKVEKSTHKRLIFNKGTITVHDLNEHKIRFEFEGEAHELTNSNGRSPVSGSVNVQY